MAQETKLKLDEILNKTFLFENKPYTPSEYKVLTSGMIVIKSKQYRSINLYESDVDDYLKKLSPLAASESDKSINIPSSNTPAVTEDKFIYTPPAENETVKTALLQTLKKVRENPSKENIEEANTVVKITDSLVALQKNEISIFNIQRRLRGNK